MLLIRYSALALLQAQRVRGGGAGVGAAVPAAEEEDVEMEIAAEARLLRFRRLEGRIDEGWGHVEVPGPGLVLMLAREFVPDRHLRKP